MMALIDNELSEPYSIFTYRYFIYNWPNLCFLAIDEASGRAFGTVVCKLDPHGVALRGYLAMLVVEKAYRGKQIGARRAVKGEGGTQCALSKQCDAKFLSDVKCVSVYIPASDIFSCLKYYQHCILRYQALDSQYAPSPKLEERKITFISEHTIRTHHIF